jgi:hypothetical protein
MGGGAKIFEVRLAEAGAPGTVVIRCRGAVEEITLPRYLFDLVVVLVDEHATNLDGGSAAVSTIAGRLRGHPDEDSLRQYAYRLREHGLLVEWRAKTTGACTMRLMLPDDVMSIEGPPAVAIRSHLLTWQEHGKPRPRTALALVERDLDDAHEALDSEDLDRARHILSKGRVRPTWIGAHLSRASRAKLLGAYHRHRTSLFMQQGDPARSLTSSERAMRFFQESGDWLAVAEVEATRSSALRIAGELERARVAASRARDLASIHGTVGDPFRAGVFAASLYPDILVMDAQSANSIVQHAVDTSGQAGHPTRLAEALLRRAQLHMRLGTFSRAHDDIMQASNLAAGARAHWVHAWALRWKLLLALRADLPDHRLSDWFMEAWRINWTGGNAFQRKLLVRVLVELRARFTVDLMGEGALLRQLSQLHVHENGAHPGRCPRSAHAPGWDTVECLLGGWGHLHLAADLAGLI